MKLTKHHILKAAPALALAGLIGTAAIVKESVGSDHQQTPLTELNPRLDITDVWVFPGSSDDRVVLAMTIASPIVGDRGAKFNPNALYQFNIDNTQDGVEDVIIQFSFDEMMNGTQTVDVIGPTSPPLVNAGLLGPISGAYAAGVTTKFAQNGRPNIRRAALNSTSVSGQIPATTGAAAGTMQVFAGLVDDPFFIDLPQFFRIIPDRRPTGGPLSQIGGVKPNEPGTIASSFRPDCGTDNTLQAGEGRGVFAEQFGCASDFLRGFNALVIAVELPEAQLTRGRGGADPELGIWATIAK